MGRIPWTGVGIWDTMAVGGAMIRILIADDHPIVREGLKRIVDGAADLSVVGEAASGEQVLQMAAGTRPDVLVLDVSMPGSDFRETIRSLRRTVPALPVLVMSIHAEEDFGPRALRAGAAGYLTKDQSPERLTEALRVVAGGARYVSPSLAGKLAQSFATGDVHEIDELLSKREYEVFRLLGRGMSVKRVAAELGISAKTVSTYRARILEKLPVASNAEIVRLALKQGIVD